MKTINQIQIIFLAAGDLRYGIGGQYLRPRTIDKYRIFKNSGQFFKRPSRTQRILNGKMIVYLELYAC